ncbi:hypothetical protein [Streptomyces sp. LUP30]|uniref:hypothetical protein n=1 Tax=Streptomyces sp. LUP30 TaxID=1890285 RepID=UPI000851CFB8|nr:hypothetical protein [Streptomyces sp. LUP30]
MAGPYGRGLDAVRDFRYMAYWVNKKATGDERLLVEIYTGWVQCDIGFVTPTTHFTFKSFLPVGPSKVRFYPTKDATKPGGIVSAAIVASPGGMGPTEDEANIFGVDKADVILEENTFPGIAGSPLCLVLNATVALLNCHMWHYAYWVQVVTNPETTPVNTTIPANQRPSGSASPEGGPVN